MAYNNTDIQMMRRAIELSVNSVNNGGGPFGCVIVKNNIVISESSNSVTIDNDPTAHAEINAIRQACRRLHTFNLSGCTLYTSCEPCPMCLGAIYWSHIDKIYFGNNATDAAKIGFDDDFIYKELDKRPADRSIPTERIIPQEAIRAFELWNKKSDKTEY